MKRRGHAVQKVQGRVSHTTRPGTSSSIFGAVTGEITEPVVKTRAICFEIEVAEGKQE